MDGVAPDLLDFYERRYREDDRLRATPHGRLELVRTRELLERFLPPPPARVLDVGGGTGIHAQWLAEAGYAVRLLDLVPAHVEVAAALAGVDAALGDARTLPEADATFDAVLLLGPLYHLLDRTDRLRALREARRVARPGAPVFAGAVSRHTTLLDYAAEGHLDEEKARLAARVIETGHYEGRFGFTDAYFHTPQELGEEVAAGGLESVVVFGVQGPMWTVLDAYGIERFDELLPAALLCARAVEQDPAVMAASSHLLAVGLSA
jgi:SAM-dependent methyltransferase